MTQESIFLPMCALALLTFVVLSLVPFVRIKAARARRVGPKDFRYGESAAVPADVSLPNRAYMNLLELPMLFYVVGLALYATKTVGAADVALAWVFVGSRLAHSIVHLTYNNVIHRLAVFGIGVVIVFIMWVRLTLTLL